MSLSHRYKIGAKFPSPFSLVVKQGVSIQFRFLSTVPSVLWSAGILLPPAKVGWKDESHNNMIHTARYCKTHK